MMIDLTVKTLDSQNHAFSLADDITIREFKEHIAETVNVPADSQRLIYCGRVLQDEKRLSEYDVNGKVIHLVQRAPPQSAQRGNSGGQAHGQNRGRGDQSQPQRTHHRQTRRQFHGNPMYLGSISIPAEVVEGHEWPIPRLTNTLSSSRLVVARCMFDQANRVLDRLDNPAAAAATTTSDSGVPETDETASGGAAAASESSQQDDTANAPELSRRYFVVRGGEEGSGTEPLAPAAETSDESQTQDSQQQSPRQGGANASGDPGCPRVRPLATPSEPRTPQMAQLVGRLMDTQDRLRPYLTRYRELMELDPEIPGGRTSSGNDIGSVEENQRLADGVTECLHFLSHANHALSDMIVDCGQEPPRNLRCRPVLIQHSAILQAGIPIQVEAHISVARNEGSNGESGEENTESTNRPPPTSATTTPPTSQYPVELTFVTEQQDQSAPNVGQQSEQQQAQSQPQVDSAFGAIFNLTNNMEVLMEMGPPESVGISVNGGVGPTGTEQSATNGSNNNNNNNNNNNAPGMSGVAGIFPWGPTPPPEVIRNLMNVVAGYMAQGAATVTTAAPATMTSTPTSCLRQRATAVAVGGGAAPNPGQSTQARSNVGTHPTTSTQTRSTPRPHVFHPQAHPLGVGVGMGLNMDFDLFLPCNSHHIHRTPSSTPNNSAATSSPQQTSQPSQSTTPTGTAQTQPDGPSVPTDQNAASNITSSSTSTATAITKTNADRGTSNTCLRDEIANARRTNTEATASTVTLEELLVSRGINVMLPERSAGYLPQVLRRLFNVCAKIELSEWYALLRDGKFSREDTWRRLRPHITNVILFHGTLRTGSRLDTTTHPGLAECLSEQIIRELQPYLSESFEICERRGNPMGGHRINFPATIEYYVCRFVKQVFRYLETNGNTVDDDEWGRKLAKIVQRFGREVCSMLQTSLHRKQAGLEELIRNFATRAMSGHHDELRDWVIGTVADWFCEYSRQMADVPGVFHHIIVYELRDGEETSGSDETTDAARSQGAHSQPEPEPMETEEVTSNRTITDPLELDDGQEVPANFPGILPEWMPIIARDSIGQRRQLQLQGTGVTAFSDAYLDGLPSKRRKLVESQKPRLLVSPTPNHSSIPASIERLVRDSVVRAGVEEADGAAAAVAADSGVRRAFGQAIRDCLHPRRLQTPDFPNSRRFPNATSYFTDKEKTPKQ